MALRARGALIQATIMALRALLLSTEKGSADVRGGLEISLNGKTVEKILQPLYRSVPSNLSWTPSVGSTRNTIDRLKVQAVWRYRLHARVSPPEPLTTSPTRGRKQARESLDVAPLAGLQTAPPLTADLPKIAKL